jgi:REP element-mobilizing transposase RayT
MKYHCPLLPDHIYHVFNHAVGSENLFREADNYSYFLELAIKYIVPIADFYAYNLLPNHFHFLIKVKSEQELADYYKFQKDKVAEPNMDWSKYVMQQFSNFCNAYSKAYNKRFERRGALFLDYIKRSPVDSVDYLRHCIHYIHYNAILHGLCLSLDEWYWTSYHTHLKIQPSRLKREVVLENFEGKQQFIKFHNGKPIISGDDLEFI